MAISEEDKKRIEEEEKYRSEIKGNLSQEKPKKKGMGLLKIIGILFLVGIFGSIVISAMNPSGQIERAKEVANQQSQSVKSTFDVPSLVGKDVDEVIATLGEPQGQDPTALQIQQGVKEWDKTFVKDGKELLVTYTISDRKIVDFFISTDDPSGVTTDKENLLVIGNLSENDPKYTVEFVKAIKDPDSYTGVKVIPNY